MHKINITGKNRTACGLLGIPVISKSMGGQS
jgi:hypothetical protein